MAAIPVASPVIPYAVVVPTLGRPSLARLLSTLAAQDGPAPERIVLVDDRPAPAAGALAGRPLPPLVEGRGWLEDPRGSHHPPHVVRTGRRGPAAARNAGWRAVPEDVAWVAFLDDDVELPDGWAGALAADLAAAEIAPERVGGTAGRIVVPLPSDRRPTDWERATAGLELAHWATADLAYRRDALARVHGFDERFPRAYREDADLALRVRRAGWALLRGERHVVHPVRPTGPWASVHAQRGNADDALMRRLHGRTWREDAQVHPGRRARHVATTAAGALGLGALTLAAARGSRAALAAGIVGAAGWAGLTAEFAVARLVPGPRTPREAGTMLATSVAIPPLAVAHYAAGALRARRAGPWPPAEAVLLDRDGTIVVDVPYNGDPALVRPVTGAGRALARLRRRGVRLGVVTNQSGVARGLIGEPDVRAVNARVDELLGPFETWRYCPHADEDGCGCRKPAPGLVLAAAADLGIPPERCVLIGDTGADVGAALAAGARAVLVPTAVTRVEEVRAAPVVAGSLPEAVDLVLAGAA